MPYSVNGIGTQYYGHADPIPAAPSTHPLISWLRDRDDGHESWIVTEWVTFLWIPLIPLGSFRVWPVSHEHSLIGNRSRTQYRVRTIGLYWPQVVWGYAITAVLVSALWLADHWWLVEENTGLLLPLFATLVLIAAGVTAWFGRRKLGSTGTESLATSTSLNPFVWERRHQLAGVLLLLLGACLGGAVGFVLTGGGAGFVDWIGSQQYLGWPVFGWALFGALVSGGIALVWRLMSPDWPLAAKSPGLRTLGKDPATGQDVVLCRGRYGLYVTDGRVSAIVPRAVEDHAVTLALAIQLIAARTAKRAHGT